MSLDGGTADSKVIGTLLGTGQIAEGLTSVAPLAGLTDPEERRAALLDYCSKVAEVLDQRFLPGPGKRDHPQVFANMKHRSHVATTPLTIDLAAEMREELLALHQLISTASPAGGDAPLDLDDSLVF